jgi:tetraacyldisaccharide 4'-kinase
LNVLSQLYGRATTFRREWYGRRPHRIRQLDRPVISVGNLVVGGSGKTPAVASIAKLLTGAGERPAILSRGYGRRRVADGVVVVSDGERVLATVEESGDEPFMLAQTLPGVPVFVAADRYLSGRLAERRFGCTVHLLDDGFQHVQLRRDVDLLVIARAHLDERLLPFGALRESVTAARIADALLVAGDDADADAIVTRVGVDTAFQLVARDLAVRPIGSADQDVLVPEGKVVAVAGIARPERFFAALRERGWDVARELAFRDHHWFTARDIHAIHQAAAGAGAHVVITTEKDAVRMESLVARGGPDPSTGSGSSRASSRDDKARPTWAVLPLEVVVEPSDRFAAWLAARLAAARRRRLEEAA